METMLRVVTLLLRALPLPLLLLLFALAECQLVSECADVLPSTDYHRQLCAASDDEATATVRSSLAGFDSGAIRRRVEGTLHCKQHLCGTAVTAPRVQSGVPDYVLALAPKCGSSSFHNLLQAHPAIVTSNRKVLPYFVTHHNEVLERCKNGDPSCKREQVAYLPGFGGRANRTADAWFYLCSTTGNYPSNPDSRNHPKVSFASEEQSAAWSSSGRAALASDHNPHTLLGNSSVARTVARFAPPNVKFLLLTCHPAKRALSTYRFRYFGKGEFAFRQQALKDLEAQGMDFGKLVELQLSDLPAGLSGDNEPWSYEGPEVLQDGADSRGVHTMVAQGMYAYAMSRWLKAGFDPSQFLLVTTDELSSEPAKMMRRVEKFLGLPEATYPQALLEHRRNANPNQLKVSASTKQALLDFYRPHNAWLERLFPGTDLHSWNEWDDD